MASDSPSPVRASAQEQEDRLRGLLQTIANDTVRACALAEFGHDGDHDWDINTRPIVERALLKVAAEARGRQQAEQVDVEAFRANLHATYNGGWHGNEDGMKAFHHGMDTVCNALKGGEAPRLTERAQQAEQERDGEIARLRTQRDDALSELTEKRVQVTAQKADLAAMTQALKDTKALLARAKPRHYPGECDHCGIDELSPDSCPTLKFIAEIDAALAGAQA